MGRLTFLGTALDGVPAILEHTGEFLHSVLNQVLPHGHISANGRMTTGWRGILTRTSSGSLTCGILGEEEFGMIAKLLIACRANVVGKCFGECVAKRVGLEAMAVGFVVEVVRSRNSTSESNHRHRGGGDVDAA